MGDHLALTIGLLDRRYHGVEEWPPAPARAFQALVAGVARGRKLPTDVIPALEWLESLPPPLIAAPEVRCGQSVSMFVPNNDADAVGGDPDRIAEIRTRKNVQPRLLGSEEPFVFVWPMTGGAGPAARIIEAAEDIYQLGRGVDMAWATAEVLDDVALDARLSRYRGAIHRPAEEGKGNMLACPGPGSLASLVQRYEAASRRLRTSDDGLSVVFAQPPKPRFVQVPYDSPPIDRVYDLRRTDGESPFAWPVAWVVALVERVRDGAAARLRDALPDETDAVERSLIGRKVDGGSHAGPQARRVRIVPLPSIGHEHADRAVRRVLVQVPPGAGVDPADVFWACSGLETYDPASGELDGLILIPSMADEMLRHYTARARRWRTVTPAALPEPARRRRIDPGHRREEAKPAAERRAEEARASSAVRTALRHALVGAAATHVHVQRESFEAKGSRVERFAAGTRFPKERLWHVELQLDSPITGPLAIGDGRFLGLGLLAPVRRATEIHAFAIEGGLAEGAGPIAAARALRRAVMARVEVALGTRRMPAFFSGHDERGAPARSEDESHVAFQAELPRRLLIVAPHLVEHRRPRRGELQQLELLERAVAGLVELRAGTAGLLSLRWVPFDLDRDVLTAPAITWVSVSPYAVTRHAKHLGAAESVARDVEATCRERGFPVPMISVTDVRGVSGRGLEGKVKLRFPIAVRGPVVLGRTCRLGGGLFAGADQGGASPPSNSQ